MRKQGLSSQQMIRVKKRAIKFHQTLCITYNMDLAIPRVRDLLKATVEVTESQG
jgi:hypothetical protein